MNIEMSKPYTGDEGSYAAAIDLLIARDRLLLSIRSLPRRHMFNSDL